MKLTPNMKIVLKLAAEGKAITTGCQGLAEHGGRETTCMALRSKGLMRGYELTEEGRKVAASLTT